MRVPAMPARFSLACGYPHAAAGNGEEPPPRCPLPAGSSFFEHYSASSWNSPSDSANPVFLASRRTDTESFSLLRPVLIFSLRVFAQRRFILYTPLISANFYDNVRKSYIFVNFRTFSRSPRSRSLSLYFRSWVLSSIIYRNSCEIKN